MSFNPRPASHSYVLQHGTKCHTLMSFNQWPSVTLWCPAPLYDYSLTKNPSISWVFFIYQTEFRTSGGYQISKMNRNVRIYLNCKSADVTQNGQWREYVDAYNMTHTKWVIIIIVYKELPNGASVVSRKNAKTRMRSIIPFHMVLMRQNGRRRTVCSEPYGGQAASRWTWPMNSPELDLCIQLNRVFIWACLWDVSSVKFWQLIY